uniref:Uncharacterized protein n=1 Tax=Ceratitis capitata TaxID=7213 RepID=W8BBJ2_CERCA
MYLCMYICIDFSNHVLSAWHTLVVCTFLLPLEKYNANGFYDLQQRTYISTHTHTQKQYIQYIQTKKLEVQDGLSCLNDRMDAQQQHNERVNKRTILHRQREEVA